MRAKGREMSGGSGVRTDQKSSHPSQSVIGRDGCHGAVDGPE